MSETRNVRTAWWADIVDDELRDVFDALSERTRQFFAQIPRPASEAIDVFCLALGDDFEAALRSAYSRRWRRIFDARFGRTPKRRSGRPRGLWRPPRSHRKRSAVVDQVLERLSQATQETRRLSQRAALAEVLFAEEIAPNSAKLRKFEQWRGHYEEGRGWHAACRAAVRTVVGERRFASFARRVSRQVNRGDPVVAVSGAPQ